MVSQLTTALKVQGEYDFGSEEQSTDGTVTTVSNQTDEDYTTIVNSTEDIIFEMSPSQSETTVSEIMEITKLGETNESDISTESAEITESRLTTESNDANWP